MSGWQANFLSYLRICILYFTASLLLDITYCWPYCAFSYYFSLSHWWNHPKIPPSETPTWLASSQNISINFDSFNHSKKFEEDIAEGKRKRKNEGSTIGNLAKLPRMFCREGTHRLHLVPKSLPNTPSLICKTVSWWHPHSGGHTTPFTPNQSSHPVSSSPTSSPRE